VKEKARFFQLQRHLQPELVTVNASELDERVRGHVFASHADVDWWLLLPPGQAKEHEIYETAPFLQSRLFTANGYTLNSDVIEKRFRQQT
jgi:DNA replication licensing factor MCM2